MNKLSKEQFDVAVNEAKVRDGLSDIHVDRARKVLVDGMTVEEAASSEGVSIETIRVAIRKIQNTGPRKIKGMQSVQFYMAFERSGVSEKYKENMALMFIEGYPPSEVAKLSGLSEVHVYRIAKKIQDVSVPVGFEEITVVLPQHDATWVKKMAEKKLEYHLMDISKNEE